MALDPDKLAALRAALATNRPRPARHLFAELRPALVGLYGEAPVAALAARLDELEFAAALHGLADLMPTPDAAASPSPAAPSQDT